MNRVDLLSCRERYERASRRGSPCQFVTCWFVGWLASWLIGFALCSALDRRVPCGTCERRPKRRDFVVARSHGYAPTERQYISRAAGHTRHRIFLGPAIARGSLATGKEYCMYLLYLYIEKQMEQIKIFSSYINDFVGS